MINSQLMAGPRGNTSKSLVLNSQKKTVANTILSKRGKETIRSRHAIPLDIEDLFKQQVEYNYLG